MNKKEFELAMLILGFTRLYIEVIKEKHNKQYFKYNHPKLLKEYFIYIDENSPGLVIDSKLTNKNRMPLHSLVIGYDSILKHLQEELHGI